MKEFEFLSIYTCRSQYPEIRVFCPENIIWYMGMGILFYLGRTLSQRLLCKAPRTHTHTLRKQQQQQQNGDNTYMIMANVRIL